MIRNELLPVYGSAEILPEPRLNTTQADVSVVFSFIYPIIRVGPVDSCLAPSYYRSFKEIVAGEIAQQGNNGVGEGYVYVLPDAYFLPGY